MILWRISNYTDLKGTGGIKTPGRWHNRGVPVVYLAESPSLALLEVLVNFSLDLDEIPLNYQLLEVEYPQRKSIKRLNVSGLHKGWDTDKDFTRSVGDQWIAQGASALLRVPSVVVPASFNYLLNPRHPESNNAKIISRYEHPYDQRLFTK